jgi:hypothetical protein
MSILNYNEFLNESKRIRITEDEIIDFQNKIGNLKKDLIQKNITKKSDFKYLKVPRTILKALTDLDILKKNEEGKYILDIPKAVPSNEQMKKIIRKYKENNRSEETSKNEYRKEKIFEFITKIYNKIQKSPRKMLKEKVVDKLLENFKDDKGKQMFDNLILQKMESIGLEKYSINVNILEDIYYKWDGDEPTEKDAEKIQKDLKYKKETRLEKMKREEEEKTKKAEIAKRNLEAKKAKEKLKELDRQKKENKNNKDKK